MSNYEAFYWIIFGEGLHRIRCAIMVLFGCGLAIISKLVFETGPEFHMSLPILFYIMALYKRSSKSNHIFGFARHPAYATFKLLVFISMLALLWGTLHEHITADIAFRLELVLLTIYGLALMVFGFFCVVIQKDDFDKVFKENFGEFTERDLAASEKLFGRR